MQHALLLARNDGERQKPQTVTLFQHSFQFKLAIFMMANVAGGEITPLFVKTDLAITIWLICCFVCEYGIYKSI